MHREIAASSMEGSYFSDLALGHTSAGSGIVSWNGGEITDIDFRFGMKSCG